MWIGKKLIYLRIRYTYTYTYMYTKTVEYIISGPCSPLKIYKMQFWELASENQIMTYLPPSMILVIVLVPVVVLYLNHADKLHGTVSCGKTSN